MVVLSFDTSIAESESQLKMHVEITGEPDSDPETPIKVVVHWINSRTGYFMAPGIERFRIGVVSK